MFEEDMDDRIYNLIISNGTDSNNEYRQFVDKIYSKHDFLWKEVISPNYDALDKSFFEKIDVIIILSGLYNDNKEKIQSLVNISKKHNIPILLVRPYGMEEVPEELESVASSLVGWNANCIVDSIKSAIHGSNYCDFE